MRGLRRGLQLALLSARIAAGGVALTRLARAARTAAPITAPAQPGALVPGTRAPGWPRSITVVVPARDEAGRIGPLLEAIVGAPGVEEVIVVDDRSSDKTAVLAERLGARVVPGTPLPDGWAGKAWALQQGLVAATTDWVVALDADTRPDPRLPAAMVDRACSERFDLLTVAGRFECPTAATRWLHAAMLTTLVYRFGPPGALDTPSDRLMANGQCMAVERERFLDRGGMSTVAGEVVEDIALARSMVTAGARVGFLDASDLLTVRMFESFGDTWHGWGRSIALPGVESRRRQVVELAVVMLAQVMPLPRLLVRRGDPVDVVLAVARIGTLVGTRRAYDRADAAYWLSPLADGPAAAAIALGIARRGRQTWRGRDYGRSSPSNPPSKA
jgi:dolichol-phosphate mannosyltransferase